LAKLTNPDLNILIKRQGLPHSRLAVETVRIDDFNVAFQK